MKSTTGKIPVIVYSLQVKNLVHLSVWLSVFLITTPHCLSVKKMLSSLSLCQLVILLLSAELSTVSCDTFYVVTSPSSPCPGEYVGVPCLTLQQYASNPSQSENITLLIEPEIYNLATVLTVSDGYSFTMSSTNATVICTSATAKFEFNRVENVHISGITFQGCRNTAVRMAQVESASIVNSNFINNQALSGDIRHGGCLNIASSSVTISDSEFRNNRAFIVEEQFMLHHQY